MDCGHNGGHVDLEKGVILRKAEEKRVAHNKRKTPVKIPPQLLTFLRCWHKADRSIAESGRTVTLRYVVNCKGERITKPYKAFRKIRSVADMDDDVTPHVLRHTRAIWLAQAGIAEHEAAAFLGLTVEGFERTFSYTSPDKKLLPTHSEETVRTRKLTRICAEPRNEKSPVSRAFRLVGVE